MKIERLDRAGSPVFDVDAAMRFFSDLLGITFEELPAERLEIKHHDPSVKGMKYGKHGISLVMDLFESIPSAPKEGVRTLMFKVSNLDDAIEEMQQKGIRLLTEVRIKDSSYKEAIFSGDDTHGTRFALCEYDANDVMSELFPTHVGKPSAK